MSLQRPLPPNILASQLGKVVASPRVFKRRSPQAQNGTRFITQFFQLAANEGREISGEWARGFLLIQNNSISALYVEFGRPATTFSYNLAPGGELRLDTTVPCDSINIFSVTGMGAGESGILIEG